MNRIYLFLFLYSVPTAGCSRQFAPPLPTTSLTAVWPSSGFTGEPVALCGANLAREAALNEIAFGGVRVAQVGFEPPADWLPPAAQDYACELTELFVRVPVLPTEGRVAVQVDGPNGRALLADAFDYRGPGHPVAERVQKVLHLRAGLWSLFAPPGIPAPAYGAVSQEADLISLFEPSLGLHLDFGQCALPLSGAVAVTNFVIDLVNPENWEAAFKIFAITADFTEESGPSDEQAFDLSLWAWDVDLKRLLFERTLAPPQEVYLPSTGDRQAFRPALVWAFPRPDGSFSHDIVVSHASRAALAIFPVETLDEPIVVELPNQPPHCQTDGDEQLGLIVDLVYDPVGQVFYAALLGGNEIWRISVDGQDVGRAWPPPDPTGYPGAIDCAWRNSALALRRSHSAPEHLRLYVGDVAGVRVRAMRPATHLGDEILEPVPYQSQSFDGFPYALTTGRFENADGLTAEHLYVATQNGLVLIDVTAYNPVLLPGLHAFRRIGEIPIPSNQGGPQSLITSDNYGLTGPDTIAFADANEDKVLFYTAGAEQLLLADVTIGATLPRLTSSYQGDRLFLTDSLSNTIQVIDRNSGMRQGQFLIASLADHQMMGFGSKGMDTLHGADYDLLMLPLLDMNLEHAQGEYERNDYLRFENIAFGRFADDLPACGLTTSDMSVETALTEKFHEMALVSWDWEGSQSVPVLVLTRRAEVVDIIDADGQPTGEQVTYSPRTWCLEIDPDAPPDGLLAVEAAPLCDLVPEQGANAEILGVRPGRRAPAIARLERQTVPGEAPRYVLRMLPQDEGSDLASRGIEYPIAPDFAPYVADLVVLRGGSTEHPRYVAYLPLSSLGMVLEVAFDTADGSYVDAIIETGGSPTRLFTSPDGRRAYVVHPEQSRVDVLKLACEPGDSCETLASTLDVEAFPADIEFDDTGRYAFVLHLFSNDVTVIE